MADDIETQDTDLENSEEKTSDTKDEKAKANETDWKAEAAKWKRIASRKEAKEKAEEAPKEEKKEPSELDYGQRALLRATLGIKGADELQLARDYMRRTGMDADALEGDDIFTAKLEKLRTTKANELAASGKSNRSGGGNQYEAEAILAKLGPNDPIPSDLPRDIAMKVVELRRGKGASQKMFYNQ